MVLLAITLTMLAPYCQDGCVQAQDLPSIAGPCAPEVSDNRRAVLVFDEDPGIWFHLEVARCMAGRLEALPLYAERVHLLGERLSLSEARDALRVREVELAEKEAETAAGALETAMRAAREAREDLDAWYRSPILWTAVGAVLAGGLIALAVWALDSVRAEP
jgi:hypothetical protein